MNRFYPYKVYWNITRLFFLRTVLRRGNTARAHTYVADDYETAWSEKIKDLIIGRKLRVLRHDGRLIVGRAIDSRKLFVNHISHTILSVQPRKVLELGSGFGINLLALAILNPGVNKFVGIELTKQGVFQSNELLKNPPIAELVYITECDESTIRARLLNRDITFIEGDIRHLPFKADSFDFVFTCWVIEQIPREYPSVFKEASRVVSGHALFLEEFKEAEENIFQRLHLRNVDYFHASYREVEKYGFDVLRFEPMPMSKIKLRYGSLFCRTNQMKLT